MLRRFLAAAVLLGSPLAVAQTPVTVGAPVSGTLDGSAPAVYTLALGAGQFVTGAVVQETVDVVVVLTAPDGTELRRIDGPALGPEPFQFETDAAGTYTLAVEPFEGASGRYTVRLDRAEPVATTPQGIVRQLMTDRMGDAPGGLVAVVEGGEVVYQEAFGMANLTHGIPYSLDTPTNIGSTSKQFTAYAVALLAERGELSLDDDVRTHISELPDLGETVTLRNLLGHTSGYREFLNTLVIGGIDPSTRPDLDVDDIIRIVQRQPRLQNVPGAEFNYNNTGFALLAEVVARVGGAPFPEWMAANVFQPLGMTHTVVRATPATLVPGSAQGYARGTDGAWGEAADLGGAMGAGAIYTTVGDLATWMTMLQTGGDHPAVVEQMTTAGTLNDGTSTGYGLGLFVDEMDGERRIQHGGADTAHRSMFAFFPDLDAGVIVLTNADANSGGLAGRTINAFLPDAFQPDEAEATTAEGGFASFDDALFDDYAGRYALDIAPDFVLTFSRDADGGGYLTQATGQGELAIVPASDSTFTLTAVQAGVTFHRDADGVVRSATLHQNGDNRATKLDVEPAATTRPVVPADYAGRYTSDELDASYTLSVEDGDLVMEHRVRGDLTFQHLRGEVFSMGGGTTVTFERDEAGAVTALIVDNGRARDIRFDRVR